MWSSRRRLERRSLSSPRWSMADSLKTCGLGQGLAHLVRPLELEPVSGAFEHDEPVLAVDVALRRLGPAPAQRGILVAPQQRGRPLDAPDVRQVLPGGGTGTEVGAVIVECRGQTSGARQRAGEMLDQRPGHRLRVGTD